MTTKEKAQELRKVLKEKGYKRNDISIRSGYCGYSSYIDVTIKNPEINRSDIEKIAIRYREVDYDERTGEVLEGGNTYVHVKYAD